MLRSILPLKLKNLSKIRDLLEETNAKNIWTIPKRLKFRYTSHGVRDSDLKRSKTMATWVPYVGQRGKGRPVIRWFAYFGTDWIIKARGRNSWKGLIETYTQLWASKDGDWDQGHSLTYWNIDLLVPWLGLRLGHSHQMKKICSNSAYEKNSIILYKLVHWIIHLKMSNPPLLLSLSHPRIKFVNYQNPLFLIQRENAEMNPRVL